MAHRGYNPLRVTADEARFARTGSACLFDLDGVLTDTASVHRKAWKEMFDAYLSARAERTGDGSSRSTSTTTTRPTWTARSGRTVSGRFWTAVASRCPRATPTTTRRRDRAWPGQPEERHCFTRRCAPTASRVFEGSRRYLDAVAAAGLAVAVVSSSANTREVLEHHRPGRVRPGARRRGDACATRASQASRRPTRSFAPPNCSTRPADQAAVFEDAIAGVAAGTRRPFRRGGRRRPCRSRRRVAAQRSRRRGQPIWPSCWTPDDRRRRLPRRAVACP